MVTAQISPAKSSPNTLSCPAPNNWPWFLTAPPKAYTQTRPLPTSPKT